jgi:hypothetical protein
MLRVADLVKLRDAPGAVSEGRLHVVDDGVVLVDGVDPRGGAEALVDRAPRLLLAGRVIDDGERLSVPILQRLVRDHPSTGAIDLIMEAGVIATQFAAIFAALANVIQILLGQRKPARINRRFD